MRTKHMRIGMRVRVHDDHRNPQLRGLVGTLKKHYGAPNSMAFEVWFPDGRTELFWAHQLEEAKELSPLPKQRRVFWQQPVATSLCLLREAYSKLLGYQGMRGYYANKLQSGQKGVAAKLHSWILRGALPTLLVSIRRQRTRMRHYEPDYLFDGLITKAEWRSLLDELYEAHLSGERQGSADRLSRAIRPW